MKPLVRRSMHSISRKTLWLVKVKRRIISSTCDLLDSFGQQGQMVYSFFLGSFRLDQGNSSFPQRSASRKNSNCKSKIKVGWDVFSIMISPFLWKKVI